MMNHIVLMGRLVRDPELRRTKSGTAVSSFTIAVDRDYVPKGAERETDFVPIVGWGTTGEFASKWFVKGTRVAVTGRLQMRNWTDKDGNQRTAAEVVADHLYFADSKKDGSTSAGGYTDNYSQLPEYDETEPDPIMDDELPF